MTRRSMTHASFTIERIFDAAPARMFKAFADPAAKRRWSAEGEGWSVEQFDTDFRVGGHERSAFRFNGGPLVHNDTVYKDIVPNERIIMSYAMSVGDDRISVSLATMEFQPSGTGTRLNFTEHGAFLDGHDNVGQREQGTRDLLEALDKELKR